MTMDLIGSQGERTFTHTAWRKLLQLAVQHGWQPAGAALPVAVVDALAADEPSEDTDAVDRVDMAEHLQELYEQNPEQVGPVLEEMAREKRLFSKVPHIDSYFHNAGYRVSPEDAQSLANALERALPDVPGHDALEHKTFEDERLPGIRLISVGTPVDAVEWFSDRKNKQLLKSFIRYCRQGGFEIW